MAPKEWAGDVCGSAQQYRKSVQKSASEFQADPTDPAKTKQDFITLLSAIGQAIQKLRTDVENAGVPDTENGAASKEQILKGLEASQQTFAKAREDVQAASGSDVGALSKVFGQVSRDIAANQQKFGKIQSKLNSPELKQAFKQVPACKNLRG